MPASAGSAISPAGGGGGTVARPGVARRGLFGVASFVASDIREQSLGAHRARMCFRDVSRARVLVASLDQKPLARSGTDERPPALELLAVQHKAQLAFPERGRGVGI